MLRNVKHKKIAKKTTEYKVVLKYLIIIKSSVSQTKKEDFKYRFPSELSSLPRAF